MSEPKKYKLRFGLSTLLLLIAAITPWLAYHQSKQQMELRPSRIVELKEIAREIVVADTSQYTVAKPFCYFDNQLLIDIRLPDFGGRYCLRIQSSNETVDVRHELASGIHNIEFKMTDSFIKMDFLLSSEGSGDICVDDKVVANIDDQFESSVKIYGEIEAGPHQASAKLKLLEYGVDDGAFFNRTVDRASNGNSVNIWIEQIAE